MIIRSILLILTLLVSNITLAANELSFTVSQEGVPPVSALALESFFAPSIIWVDDAGNTTELPKIITTSNTTAFYGMDFSGAFTLQVVYGVEENQYFTGKTLTIDMTQSSCLVNGKAEDVFTTNKYTYLVSAEITSLVRDNVKCLVTVNIDQSSAPMPVLKVEVLNTSNISPTPVEPPRSLAVLADGAVILGRTENNATTCDALDFSNCDLAVAQNLEAGNKSTLFNFTPDPLNWVMEAEMRYAINDPELLSPYDLVVTLQDGIALLDRCVAEVIPTPEGQLQYQASVIPLENDYCQVSLTRSIQPLPNSPTMQLVINNQLGRTENNGNLIEGEAEVDTGIFNTGITDIVVNESKIMILSALDGAGSVYKSQVYYSFDDVEMNNVPTGLQININNAAGTELSEWCKAGITGWNEGYRIYEITTEVAGDEINAVCTIDITSEDNPNEPVDYGFSLMDTLPTEGIRQWEHFTIDGNHYLAAANSAAENTDYIKQNVFKLDSNTNKFTALNNLLTGYQCIDSNYKSMLKDHAYNWHYFEVDGRKSLIMANYYTYPWKTGQMCDTSGRDYWANSYIYDWKNGDFNIGEGCCDSLMTDSVLMWEFYTHAGQSYLAAAEQGLAGKSKISIYQWSNGQFVKTSQPNLIQTNVQFVNAFSVENGTYVLFSSDKQNQETLVYSVEENGQLVLHQGNQVTPNEVLTPEGYVNSSHLFQSGDEYFLMFGFNAAHAPDVAWVYRWEYVSEAQRYLFVPYEILPASIINANAWTHFNVNGKILLAASLNNQGVVIYQWNMGLQQLESRYFYSAWPAGDSITSMTSFHVNNTPYMALATERDSNNNLRTRSPILRWQSQSK